MMRATCLPHKTAPPTVRRCAHLVVLCLVAASSVAGAAADDPPAAPEQAAAVEFFEKHVHPVLAERCWSCHGAESAKNGLRLDSRAAMLAGGELGPAIVPGDAGESLIVQAIQYDDLLKMPPKAKLPESEVNAITQWVEQGAVWPDHGVAINAPQTPLTGEFDLAQRARHWCFQPVSRVDPPEVLDKSWPLNPIDRFILAALEAQRITPAAPADRRTLIRRLTFDLIGLPPSPDEIDAFLADQRPDAYQRLVDRLLASPQYGERWGRHWLDLVRYVETSGHEFDYDIPYAWRYRDYVIRALNADLPIDDFAREHISGDLINPPRVDPATGQNESIVATSFYWFGDGTHSPVDVREEQLRRFDNQIDVLGKTFLGLTIACARCHDHKFDPITQRDYYALAGMLKSSRYAVVDAADQTENRELAARLRDNARALGRLVGANPKPIAAAPDNAAGAETTAFALGDRDDFRAWQASGLAFAGGPSIEGDAHVTSAGRITRTRGGSAHSALAAEALEGTLRSPTFTINNKYVHSLAAGRGGRIQIVVDGFEKVRDPIYGGLAHGVDHGEEPRWVTQDVSMWIGHRAYIELIDGGMPDFAAGDARILSADGFIAVEEVCFSDEAAPPHPAPPPSGESSTISDTPDAPTAQELWTQRRALLQQLQAPTRALAIVDGSPEDEFFLARGNAKHPRDPVARRFLEVLLEKPDSEARAQEPGVTGSGRLELACQVTSPRNPLFARVAVNRLWQHHFGRGLVSTPDDFGRMGQPPSHPELLDWLAQELIDSGYSLKHLHRLMVCSQTYRMASARRPDAETADPDNRLLHRANVRRLEAEAIRDSILAAAGGLNQRFYGPGVAPHLTEFMEGRGRPAKSGPLDSDGRRSIYINLRRNFPPGLLTAFDLPPAATTIGRRNQSNVPAQALALLNDPFVLDQSQRWAKAIIAEPGSDAERLERAFLRALGRPPLPAERELLGKTLAADQREPSVEAWSEVCHVLINLKEFIFIP